MATLFISDLHLTPQRPHTIQLFVDFADGEASRAEALYILGDLFEYWIGDDAAGTLGHGIAVAALARLTQRGVPVYFMRGNRDFLVGDTFARETGCTILPDPTVTEIYGRAMLLMHGDSLCTDDVDHQRFRRIVDDQGWQHEFLSQPIPDRIRMALNARQKSEFNKMQLDMAIMDVNAQAVNQALTEHRVRTLIHGHTHRPAIHDFRLASEPARRIVLGAWHGERSVLSCTPEAFALSAENQRTITVPAG